MVPFEIRIDNLSLCGMRLLLAEHERAAVPVEWCCVVRRIDLMEPRKPRNFGLPRLPRGEVQPLHLRKLFGLSAGAVLAGRVIGVY